MTKLRLGLWLFAAIAIGLALQALIRLTSAASIAEPIALGFAVGLGVFGYYQPRVGSRAALLQALLAALAIGATICIGSTLKGG